jgi:hypothetical protein
MIFPLAGYFSFVITNATVQKNELFQIYIPLMKRGVGVSCSVQGVSQKRGASRHPLTSQQGWILTLIGTRQSGR